MSTLKYLTIFVVILASTGCSLIPSGLCRKERHLLCHRTSAIPENGPLGTVDIGGAVETPQVMEIPARGLTLAQALTRAGRILADGDTMYVSLSRNTLGISSNYYFPPRMVLQDYAGQIPLQDGDLLRVQSVEEAGLLLDAPKVRNPSITVGVAGQSSKIVPIPVGDDSFSLSGLGDVGVTLSDYGVALLVLSRPSSGGLARNHFFIPLPMNVDPIVLSYPIHPHDELTVTQLQLVPLIQQTLVSSMQRAQEKRRQSLADLDARPSLRVPALETARQSGRAFIGRFIR